MPIPGQVWQGKVWQPGPGFLGGKWVAPATPQLGSYAAAMSAMLASPKPAPAKPAPASSSSSKPFVWQGKTLQTTPGFLGATYAPAPPQPLPLSSGFLGTVPGSILQPASSVMADKTAQVATKKGLSDYLDDIGSFAGKVGSVLGSIQQAFGGGVAPPSSPAPAAPAPGPGVVPEPPSIGAPPTPSVAPFLLLGGGALALVLLLR